MWNQIIDVFASEQAVPKSWPPYWHRFRGVELAVVIDAMPQPVTLLISAHGGLQFEIPGEVLVDGLRLATGEDGGA